MKWKSHLFTNQFQLILHAKMHFIDFLQYRRVSTPMAILEKKNCYYYNNNIRNNNNKLNNTGNILNNNNYKFKTSQPTTLPFPVSPTPSIYIFGLFTQVSFSISFFHLELFTLKYVYTSYSHDVFFFCIFKQIVNIL